VKPLTELLTFLSEKMSMTDVYQPAVILHLLERGGTSGKHDLARTLAGYDESVQEYYERILMRWPKATLIKHEVVSYDRKSRTFSLNFDIRDEFIVKQAKDLCDLKIQEWIARRSAKGERAKVDASTRYKILKAARGKCELCGISAKVCPIDIDHIVPQSKADKRGYVEKDGERMPVDDERNLQALCFRCNRAKRDQDSTDFRLSHRKLVRDRIPAIIRSEGRNPVIKQLRGDPLKSALLDKLTEEHAELLAAMNLDEVVDMMEVLIALGKLLGHDEQATLTRLRDKRQERGGFDQGFFLVDITNLNSYP
jgi:predicted house-cleaning noncanonical NTP pyrophosphatase (MazG superfamily)